MAELELSIMSRGPTTAEGLRPLLKEFESENHVRVSLRVLEWDTAWAELLKVALYRHGPAVSEIGTTWLGSLMAMNALHAFSDHELSDIGGPSTFIVSTWQSRQLAQTPQEKPMAWAVPWWADTRILYYRRDILARVGIDETTAFRTAGSLAQTLQHLQEGGVSVPWVVPTHESRMTIHNLASWVWGAGGDFVSSDDTCTQFNRPEARAGIHAYFDLARYLVEPVLELGDTQSDALFCAGQAAVTISGPWLLQFADEEVVANTGLALPPGVPFVGGSHLVCWKHAVYGVASAKLIRFLTSPKVQAAFGRRAGLLPTRRDVLLGPPFVDDPLYQIAAKGLEKGRSFPSFSLWGLVEEKLSECLSHLWADVLVNRNCALDELLTARLDPLAQSLDATLGNRC